MKEEYFDWLDLSKFNRLFTVGCSFTHYRYPTWADIMHKAMPHAEFHNGGRAGGGNLFISNRITEIHRKFNLTESDLVMIMWSTHCREDRFVNNKWVVPGNIYTQDVYEEKFVKEFCQPTGYLLRDISLIDMTNSYLDNLPCTYVGMLSVPFDYQQSHNDTMVKEILGVYNDVVEYFPTSMFELEMNSHWTSNIEYEFNGSPMIDYHPSPLNYYNYLKALGLPINDAALEYAAQSDTLLRSMKSFEQILLTWPDLGDYGYRFDSRGFW